MLMRSGPGWSIRAPWPGKSRATQVKSGRRAITSCQWRALSPLPCTKTMGRRCRVAASGVGAVIAGAPLALDKRHAQLLQPGGHYARELGRVRDGMCLCQRWGQFFVEADERAGAPEHGVALQRATGGRDCRDALSR